MKKVNDFGQLAFMPQMSCEQIRSLCANKKRNNGDSPIIH